MGTPLVYGKKWYPNVVMIQIKNVNNRKVPYSKQHKRDKKPCAVEHIYSGKISLGMVHPRGPHDHPNASRNKQMVATNNAKKLFNFKKRKAFTKQSMHTHKNGATELFFTFIHQTKFQIHETRYFSRILHPSPT